MSDAEWYVWDARTGGTIGPFTEDDARDMAGKLCAYVAPNLGVPLIVVGPFYAKHSSTLESLK